MSRARNPGLLFHPLDSRPALGMNFASAHKRATPRSPDLDGTGITARRTEMLHDFCGHASARGRGAS